MDDSSVDQRELAFATLFIYFSLAQTDGLISQQEQDIILKKLNLQDRFTGFNLKPVMDEAIAAIESSTLEERLEYAARYVPMLATNEPDRKQFLKDLEDIMEADGVVKSKELNYYRQIRLLLV